MQWNIDEGQQLDSGQLVGVIDVPIINRVQLLQNKKTILSGARSKCAGRSFENRTGNAIRDRERTEEAWKGGVASSKQLDDANANIATLRAKIDVQESSLRTTASSLNEQGTSVDAQMKKLMTS
jgi:multidrug resistance efflux pump